MSQGKALYDRTSKQKLCMRCNLYHVSCWGEKFERVKSMTNKLLKDCVNRVCGRENTPSRIQVDAFISLHKIKVATGMDPVEAFVVAIVQTSDNAFREAVRKRPHLIAQHRDNRKGKWTKQRKVSVEDSTETQ